MLEVIYANLTDEERRDVDNVGSYLLPVYLLWDHDNEIQKGTFTNLSGGDGSDCGAYVSVTKDKNRDLVAVERSVTAAVVDSLETNP